MIRRMGHPAEGLHRALAASGVRAGDEVVVPSYVNVEVVEAVRLAGGVPVFADIDGDSFCLDPAAVAAVVTPRTTAVVPVHQFGLRADMVQFRELAGRYGLLVVEHESAPPSASGDAARRQARAAWLTARLTGVITPWTAPGTVHTYQQYVVRVPGNGRPDRDAFAMALRNRGVRCHVPVRTPVHRMPQFRRDVWLPETERAVDECLSLSLDTVSSRRDLHRIASACNALGGLLPAAA